MRQRLTERFVSQVKASDQADSFYWDTGPGSVVGLGLKVTKGGKKQFIFQYRLGVGRSAKVKRISMGAPSSALNVKKARSKASKYLDSVNDGRDPAAELRQAAIEASAAENRTFEGFLTEEFVPHIKERMRTAHEIERILRREFLSLWRHRDIGDIAQLEIKERLKVIKKNNGPHLCNKAQDVLGLFFRHAADEGKIKASPVAGMKKLFTPDPNARSHAIKAEDLAKIWTGADRFGYPYGQFIKLLTLTLCRRGEVAGMQRKELNRDDGTWEIPPERSKNKKPLIIPLCAAAWEIIDEAEKLAPGKKFVFTTTGTVPINGFSKAKRKFDEATPVSEPWMLHDLRRTGATALVAKLGVPVDIMDLCLNHSRPDPTGTRANYLKYQFLPEKTEALEKWADYVLAAVAAADADNVVKLRGA